MPVGRETEAAKISRFLGELPCGSRVLLIEGEVGIGKTTLLREAQDIAARLATWSCPHFPLSPRCLWSSQGWLTCWNGSRLPWSPGYPYPSGTRSARRFSATEHPQRSADPRTTATAVLTLLRSLAKKHPVLVIVDDLQWLDNSSACALSFALRRLRLEPVGLLAAVRTDWSGNLPPLATDGVPAERVDHLRLGPLSLGAIRELLATRTMLSPGRSLLLRLHETSGGKPAIRA